MRGAASLAAFTLWIGLVFPGETGADGFRVPPLTGLVVDQGGFLSPEMEIRLANALLRLKKMTGGTEVAVLTLPDLGGATIEERSIQVVDAWKLGESGKDNGVLLLFSRAERRVRIEVGRGFEGELTDAHSRRIIDQVILPRMRQGDADQAILAGVAQIVKKIHPEVDLESLFGSQIKPSRESSRKGELLSLLPLIFILLFLIGGRGGRRRGFGGTLLDGMFLGSMMGGGRGFGGGSGGSGFGGSFGGGGGFSGGGASGGW